MQRDRPSFDALVTELKKHSADCKFETLCDSLIRDIIICGINDNCLCERLLREPELTLQKAVQLGHAAEETKRHVKELQNDTVHKKKFDGNGKKNVPRSSSGCGKSLIKNCKFCSYTHKRGNCSAYGKKCKNCLKPNHFAKFCPNKSANVKKKVCQAS